MVSYMESPILEKVRYCKGKNETLIIGKYPTNDIIYSSDWYIIIFIKNNNLIIIIIFIKKATKTRKLKIAWLKKT